jgi:DNA-binding protein
MTNTYFATALVGGHSVGISIRARNIAMAFEVAERFLKERYTKSDVIVQAVQRITNEFVTKSGE